MDWLNYHHLYYFWAVAREGSMTAAAQSLRLSPSTLSAQIRQLEESLGQDLFVRAGRGLVLTEFGTQTLRYADEVFAIGRELMDLARGLPMAGPVRFDVGVTEVVPKLMVRRLVEPALADDRGVRLTVREGPAVELLADLARHRLDVVITDAPAGPDTHMRVFNHLLGEWPVALFAAPELARKLRRSFPAALDGAPFLLPTPDAVLRRLLDAWFDRRKVHPVIAGEFQDAAQLKSFGELGLGAFAAPQILADAIARQYQVELVGPLEGVRERFYAVSVERKIKHTGVAAMLEAARARDDS